MIQSFRPWLSNFASFSWVYQLIDLYSTGLAIFYCLQAVHFELHYCARYIRVPFKSLSFPVVVPNTCLAHLSLSLVYTEIAERPKKYWDRQESCIVEKLGSDTPIPKDIFDYVIADKTQDA